MDRDNNYHSVLSILGVTIQADHQTGPDGALINDHGMLDKKHQRVPFNEVPDVLVNKIHTYVALSKLKVNDSSIYIYTLCKSKFHEWDECPDDRTFIKY